jgi:diguanylate cyclase (GGDEF)-like protein
MSTAAALTLSRVAVDDCVEMNLLARYNERVRGRPDSEHSQAVMRIGLVGLCLVYTSWVASHDPQSGGTLWLINMAAAVYSVALLAHILWKPGASPPRRVLGAIHDNLVVTLWLHEAGTLGALYLFVFPFVTVGNGFRFGVRYLAWSGVLGTLGIASLLVLAPEWRAYGSIGIGILLSHLLVTIYTGALLRRLQKMQVQLQRMATYDSLTGLPNRWFFTEKVEHLLAARHRGNLACLFLDLDGFKLVNDRCGHAVGDLLLKRVADRISESVRLSDMPARLGGDEFAVVLDRLASPDDARATAERIIASIESITHVDDHAVAVSVSVGIAFLPAIALAVPATAQSLLKSADEAMYAAKSAGKARDRLVDVAAA